MLYAIKIFYKISNLNAYNKFDLKNEFILNKIIKFLYDLLFNLVLNERNKINQ